MGCCDPLSPDPGETTPLDDPAAEAAFASLCKALGHPLRVRIMRVLLEREGCVCGDLVEVLPVAQSTVSQHLKVLKGAGLIQGEVDGPRVCYCVDREALKRVSKLTGQLFFS